MIDSIEIQDESEHLGQPGESSEKTTDISKVVEGVINDTLDQDPVSVKSEDYTA